MALQEEVARIKQAKADIKASIEAKGGTVGDGLIDTYASAIDNLPSGGGDGYFLTSVPTEMVRSSSLMRKLIKRIPEIDTSNAWDFGKMFEGFSSLEEIPVFDTTSLRYANDMFSGCSSLKTIPLIDFSMIKSFYGMFASCSSLTTIPLIDTSSATSMMYMFRYCSSLTDVPLLNTSNVTDLNSMFEGCTSLKSIPQFDTSKVKSWTYVFKNCTALETVPLLDANKASGCTAFEKCVNLTNLGGLKNLGMAYYTTTGAMMSGLVVKLSDCINLTHDSLMNVINNLYDIKSAGVQTQSLELGSENISKLSADEILAATNKGWTVS